MAVKSALAATGGAFLAFALAAHAQPAPPEEAPEPVPERQLTYAQSGIRLSLGTLVFGQRKNAMTLVIENTRAPADGRLDLPEASRPPGLVQRVDADQAKQQRYR
jgi:hypothetical protein